MLVGVSRTSKTPTSIYLANRGVKTANVPLVPGVPVPPQLETLAQPLVVGLNASPERIVQIRQNRLLGLSAEHDADQYIDRQAVAEEIAFSRKLCGKHNWPIIDVTRRSIEETAAAVMALLAERRRQPASLTRCRCGLPREPLVLASKSAARRALLEAAGIPVEIDARRYRRTRGRGARRAERSGEVGGAAGAREGAGGGAQACPAALCSAPTRRWRSASGGFPSRRSRRRARAIAALRGKTHALHSAVAVVRDGAVVFEHVDAARLTMRAFSDEFLESYLDAVGDAATASVGGYQLEGVGHPIVRAGRGRSFHHPRPAAAAAAAIGCGGARPSGEVSASCSSSA